MIVTGSTMETLTLQKRFWPSRPPSNHRDCPSHSYRPSHPKRHKQFWQHRLRLGGLDISGREPFLVSTLLRGRVLSPFFRFCVFFLSLWLWTGLGGMLTFFATARFSCTSTHTSCYATASFSCASHIRHAMLLLVSLAHSHIRHATLVLGFSCTSTHTSCYATASFSCAFTHTSCYATARFLLHFHTNVMRRYC